MARTIWFHVPSEPFFPFCLHSGNLFFKDYQPVGNETLDQAKARSLIEKKTAINLLEAFAVAIKHYLRGEDGIYYKCVYLRHSPCTSSDLATETCIISSNSFLRMHFLPVYLP